MMRLLNPMPWFRSAWPKKRFLIAFLPLIAAFGLNVFLIHAFFVYLDTSSKTAVLLFSAITTIICFALGFLGPTLWGQFLSRRIAAQDSSGLSRLLRQHLLNAQEWDEFVERLLRFPKTILPLTGASLHICYPVYGTCVLVKEFGLDQDTLESFPNFSDLCSYDILTYPQPLGFFIPTSGLTCFSLPFLFADRNVGVLSLYFSSNRGLSPSQIAALNDLSADVQIYLERAYLKHLLTSSAEAVQKEQLRIAGYLHDTVAQDIALLKFYLAQLDEDDAEQAQAETLVKLQHVYAIAEQAEHHIRSSMADLRKEPAPQFDAAMMQLVDDFRRRTQFSVEVLRDGDSQNLPAHFQRKVFYIVREGLRNVEKHAHATKVTICTVWNPGSLRIEIVDDGHGFVSESALKLKGHFGLKIMQETARDLNGQLSLTSTPGDGTQLTITLPLPSPSWQVEPFDTLLYS